MDCNFLDKHLLYHMDTRVSYLRTGPAHSVTMPKNKNKNKNKDKDKDTKDKKMDNSSDAVSSDSDAPDTAEGSLGLIMSKLLKTNTTSTPVLAKRKAVERQLEEEKLEKRARALVRQELREKRDSAHRVPTMEDGNYEKGLRKYANKGVVQLFNAVQQHQLNKERAEKAAKEAKEAKLKKKPSSQVDPKDGTVSSRSDSLAKEVSKASFLELLKMSSRKPQ